VSLAAIDAGRPPCLSGIVDVTPHGELVAKHRHSNLELIDVIT